MHAMVWAVVAAVLVLLELTTTALVFVMLGIGAAAAAVAAGAGGGVVVQFAAFGAVSIATLVFARPTAMKRLHGGPEHRQGIDTLIGREALVVEKVDGHDGRVRISGEIWSARAYDGQTEYEVGDRVDVAQIEGATALVL
ncbi:membrane protein implicated in regulation of membrane protease activity [Catenulispora sp. MAP12-49]|uniref:NfeD family protein n=1 Tax=unclassified Catenulispora TaxID=414885 RepID=UPI003511FF77